MAEPIVLGIVGIKNMGEYDASTDYEKLNVVTYQGSTYCALQNTKGNLPTNTDYWQLYAQKGDTGNTGPQGPQGPKPVKGVDYYTSDDKAEIEEDLVDDISDEVSSQLSTLTSATPLVAETISDMTDTTRIYVLITDGHWYWYDGTDWQDGGIYQATQNVEKSIKYLMLEDILQEPIVPSDITTSDYINENKVYDGNVGSAISLSTQNGIQSGYMDVEEGDAIIVPFAGSNYYSSPALIFTDANDIIISKITKTTINSTVNTDGKIFKTLTPSGAKKLYFNNKNEYGIIWYPFKVTKFDTFDKRVTENLKVTETVNKSTTIENKIFDLYVWDYSNNNYKTDVYNVNPFEKINVDTYIPGDSAFVPVIFLNDDDKPVGFYYQRGTTYDVHVNFDTIVPASATKMYTCIKNAQSSSVSRYIKSNYKVRASLQSNVLTLTNIKNGNYLKFKNWGGNNLFMIDKFKVGSNEITTYTDLIPAPYIVFAVNNADGDSSNKTHTGGNHQYNDQGSGATATARQVSLNIYCDGKPLSNNSTIECDNVKIIEVNRIQGTNTKKIDGSGREILEEKLMFDFDGTHLKVKNTITPLEEVIIEKYFGIQTASFDDSLYKIYSDKVYTTTTQSQVPKKPDAIYGSDIVCSKMSNSGLGDYRYNNTAGKKAVIGYHKSYYVPIFDNSVHFTTSDINYIEGEYIFDKNQI